MNIEKYRKYSRLAIVYNFIFRWLFKTLIAMAIAIRRNTFKKLPISKMRNVKNKITNEVII